jgi:hypothetical protein
MSFRHAATLIFVGWYLLLPPRMTSNPRLPDIGAPLSRWMNLGAYHQSDECLAARAKTYKSTEKGLPTASNRFFQAQIASSQCVATSDPRLKGR